MKPHSDKIVFFDAEFTDLDPKKGELLSVGLVKPNGDELYIELDYDGECHPWVIENVLPHLDGVTIKKNEARRMISEFLGDRKPFLISYVNQLDAVYWYDFFGSAKEHPAFWIPIDFASILFAYGYSPNSLGNKKLHQELGIDFDYESRGHHALDDARFLKEVYMKFMRHNG
jgi:DNA polymerase III epsilon subunit-like protein